MMPMSDESTLLAAIRAQPGDDTLRLLYGDWLEGRAGEYTAASDRQVMRDRACYIRLSVEASDLNEGDPRKGALLHEAERLLDLHRGSWEQALREIGATAIVYDRGLPVRVRMSLRAFLQHGSQIPRISPTVTFLDLSNSLIGSTGAAALGVTLHLRQFTHLDLGENVMGHAAAWALATSPYLQNVTWLRLANNGLGDIGANALARSPHLRRLTHLDLRFNGLGDNGAYTLATSPNLCQLTHLNMACNCLEDNGARELATGGSLRKLVQLDLTHNPIGMGGLQLLARSAVFPADMHLAVGSFSGRFRPDFHRWVRAARRG